jgi:bifunctional ADP-heptose synthase (sugar kinase/adenylyltransferase)
MVASIWFTRSYLADPSGQRRRDRLVMALNSDASVRRLKGATRPVQDEVARAQ